MTREEIKRYVEDDFDYHLSEHGTVREEAYDLVMTNIILRYYDDLISRHDLEGCADYLGYDLKFDEIEKQKTTHKINKFKYKARRVRKKLGETVRYSIGEDGKIYKTINDDWSYWISKEKHELWTSFEIHNDGKKPLTKRIGEDKAAEIAVEYGMDIKEFFEVYDREELKDIVTKRKKQLMVETAYTGRALNDAVVNSFFQDLVNDKIGEEKLRSLLAVLGCKLKGFKTKEETVEEKADAVC